jgi:hypothetical protein
LKNNDSNKSSNEADSMLDPDNFAHPKHRYSIEKRNNLSGRKSYEYADNDVKSIGRLSNA